MTIPFGGVQAQYVVITTAVSPDDNYGADPTWGDCINEVRFYPAGVQLWDLTGIAELAGFTGSDKTLAPITLELLRDGSPVATKTLSSGDSFEFLQLVAGNYTVKLSGATRLIKTVDIVLDANKDLGTIIIQGGDANGDGSVGLLDLGILKQAWGQHS